MSEWITLGRKADGMHAYLVSDNRIAAQSDGADEAAVLSAFETTAQPALRIGDGQPVPLPAPVLPQKSQALVGFSQEQPPDMIDAWTRLSMIGLLEKHPQWDGVVCVQNQELSHWVHLSAGDAVSSKSFLTPRLISMLSGVQTADPDAIAESLSRPEQLASHLRQAELSFDARKITGHLIGAELAAARAFWLGQQVALISDTPSAMGEALKMQSLPFTCHSSEDLTEPALAALGEAWDL